ncbi:MAG TPA: transglycosylase SLT domain-containing protein [Atribacterota bacterium]|nr:transglycosylase SLT domain-containing protein [Atribacterota bacterium]HOR42490.1 transglycosylase SLT domain-containing protein [Atribacterota bacterium]HPK87115.1 transglycosylase SLT domain-containing protein [Atribacterota bacterium]
MEQRKNVTSKKGKILEKINNRDQYFTKYFIIFLILLPSILLIYGIRQYEHLSKAIDNLNRIYNEVQTENKTIKEQIEKQVQKLDAIDLQINNYLEDGITKEQFADIYKELQELKEKMSEVNKTVSYLERIESIVASNNKQLKSDMVNDIARNIYQTALSYEFNPFLICALIKVESNFKIDSISNSNAYGLCQVSLFTGNKLAPHVGIKWDGAEKTLLNPENNIKIGTHYLSSLYNDFGDLKLALTAYNYGPTRIQEFISQDMKIPNGYADKILRYYAQYEGFSMEELDRLLTLKWSNS